MRDRISSRTGHFLSPSGRQKYGRPEKRGTGINARPAGGRLSGLSGNHQRRGLQCQAGARKSEIVLSQRKTSYTPRRKSKGGKEYLRPSEACGKKVTHTGGSDQSLKDHPDPFHTTRRKPAPPPNKKKRNWYALGTGGGRGRSIPHEKPKRGNT